MSYALQVLTSMCKNVHAAVAARISPELNQNKQEQKGLLGLNGHFWDSEN